MNYDKPKFNKKLDALQCSCGSIKWVASIDGYVIISFDEQEEISEESDPQYSLEYDYIKCESCSAKFHPKKT